MVRIESKAFRLCLPDFADVFVGSEAAQCLEASTKIVGVDEVVKMRRQLRMAVIMVAFDSGFLDRPVHPLDLAIGPGVPDLGQPVFDPVLATAHVEHVRHVGGRGTTGVARRKGELDAPFDCLPAAVAQDRIIRQNSVDRVGHSGDQRDEECGSRCSAGPGYKLDKSELAGPVDRHIEIELAFGGTHFGDVDVEIADRVGLELPLRFLVARHLWQPADAMPLQTAMQG